MSYFKNYFFLFCKNFILKTNTTQLFKKKLFYTFTHKELEVSVKPMSRKIIISILKNCTKKNIENTEILVEFVN